MVRSLRTLKEWVRSEENRERKNGMDVMTEATRIYSEIKQQQTDTQPHHAEEMTHRLRPLLERGNHIAIDLERWLYAIYGNTKKAQIYY
jgi:hypothetical protein